ncbi:MAG: hypothetical protein GW942_01135 [Candidatus Pacebacteria bacterium]|nr:hypothetical protein [Candidatus Paceibacterota bacterium]
MPKRNLVEGEKQGRNFHEEVDAGTEDESNIERIVETEWLKQLLLERLELKVAIDEHNATIVQFNTTLEFAREIEDVSGLRSSYFKDTEGYPVIEVDSKKYGYNQPVANDEEDHGDEGRHDEGENFENEDLEMITADEWFLISYQIITSFNGISNQLDTLLDENINKEETVEMLKGRNGLRIIYTVDVQTGELSYEVVQKSKMGFSVSKSK